MGKPPRQTKRDKIMKPVYLNTKLYGKVETLDELNQKDFKDWREFRAEQKRLKSEYILAGGHGEPYWSSRCTKAWKE